jgi:hypothetical protein
VKDVLSMALVVAVLFFGVPSAVAWIRFCWRWWVAVFADGEV